MSSLRSLANLISPEVKLSALLSYPQLSLSQIEECSSLFKNISVEQLKIYIDVNRIWACAYDNIREHFIELLPSDFVAYLARKRKQNAQLSLLQFVASNKIEQSFRANLIPLKIIKGIPLAKTLFGDISKRYSADIDILIPEQHLDSAHAQLGKLGFNNTKFEQLSTNKRSLLFRSCKDVTYTNPQNLTLELHIRLSNENSPLSQCFTKSLLEDESDCDGILIELLYNFWHGSHTLYHRLKWLLDISLYLEFLDLSDRQTKELFNKAKELEVADHLVFGWVLAHLIYATPLPPLIEQYFEGNSTQVRLVKNAILALNAPEKNLCFRHKLNIFLGELALISSFKKKCDFVVQKLRPTNLDIYALPRISDRTLFFYYLFRPLRIIHTEIFKKRLN